MDGRKRSLGRNQRRRRNGDVILTDIKRKEVFKMTKEEIITRIEQLNKRLFLMNMIDRWTNEDREQITKMENELCDLEMQLA